MQLNSRSTKVVRGCPPGQPAKLTGKIVIDPAASAPFRLDAVLAIDAVDAEKVLPRPGRDEALLLEGRFTFSDHLTATAETPPPCPVASRDRLR